MPRSLGVGVRVAAQRVLLGGVGAAILLVGGFGWRLVGARSQIRNLREDVASRQTRLAEDRRIASSLPSAPSPDALDRSRAVSRLRGTLASLATGQGFTIEEFQASTEEAPFLTVYASDNKDPGWVQVPVRILLKGRSTTLLTSLAKMRELTVPFEVDSVELTRQSTDSKGVATVVAQIGLRVLVYRGEA